MDKVWSDDEINEALDAAQLAITEYYNGDREFAEQWLMRAMTANSAGDRPTSSDVGVESRHAMANAPLGRVDPVVAPGTSDSNSVASTATRRAGDIGPAPAGSPTHPAPAIQTSLKTAERLPKREPATVGAGAISGECEDSDQAHPQSPASGAAGSLTCDKGSPAAKPKKTRAPNGTFDRKAYQRDLMRRRRQAEKREK